MTVLRRPPSIAPIPLHDVGYVLLFLATGVVLALMFVRVSPFAATAAILALLLAIAFLASPWVALLTVLLIRASTDLSYSIFGGPAQEGSLVPALPNIILILALVGAGGLSALRMRGLGRLPAFHLLLLLLAGGIVGVLRTTEKVSAVSQWLPLVGIFVIYILSANLPGRPRDVQRIITVVLLSSILPAAFGLYQLATGQGRFLPEEQVVRIHGTFVHPNAFGIYLVLVFGVLLARYVCAKDRRNWDLVGLGLTSLMLLGTFMRGAWVGAAAIVAIIGVLRARWLLVAFPLAAVILVLAIPGVGARTADPLGAGSFRDRLHLWTGIYREWHRETVEGVPASVAIVNRVGGLGPGAAELLTARVRWKPFAAHNDYLRVLVEYGFFGIAVQLAIIMRLLSLGYTSYERLRGQPLDFVPLAFLAVTVAYSVMSLTDNVFGATQNQVYYWTLAGVSVATQRISTTLSALPREVERGDALG